MARDIDAEQPPHVHVGRDRQQRIITALLGRHDRIAPRRRRRVGQRADHVGRVRRRSGSSRIASTGVGGCACASGFRDAKDPRGVGGRGVGAERVREPPVRAFHLVARQRLGERPVRVAVAAGARRDDDRRGRLEVARAPRRLPRRRSRPTGRRRARRRRGRRGGACAARSRRRRRCAGRARSRAWPIRADGRALEELSHPLPVLEPVAQLEQLVRVRRAGERGEEPCRGLVAGEGRGAHGVQVEVVGPAAGAAPRARDGGQAAWWASRAAPSVAG